MFESITDFFAEYLKLYYKAAVDWWAHIGPTEYTMLLSAVGILGYLSMLRGSKRLT